VQETIQTFEEQARDSLISLDGPPDADAREHYTLIFLIDYANCFDRDDVTADHFLRAYSYKIRAMQHGAQIEALDEEGYRLRQSWAAAYDRRLVAA